MFFGIPVTPPFYYLMRLPMAQVELMAIDQSIVVYPKEDKVETGDGKTRSFTRPTNDELEEANQYWEREKAKYNNKKKD